MVQLFTNLGNSFKNTFGVTNADGEDEKFKVDSKFTKNLGIANIAGSAASALSGLLSGGKKWDGSDIVSGISNTLGTIPLVGGVFKGGLDLLNNSIGGLFGTKIDENKVNDLKNQYNSISLGTNTVSNTNDLLALNKQFGSTQFTRDDLGTEGIFNNGNKLDEIMADITEFKNKAMRNMVTSALNLLLNSINGILNNTAAFGGSLSTHGSEFPLGYINIENGGTHESNPLGGVMMGVDLQGTPNLVEEGEVLWNDYVFSNRLKVPLKMQKRLKLGNNKDMTFADAMKKVEHTTGLDQRPNDFISKNMFDDTAMQLMMVQEPIRQKKEIQKQQKVMKALGGNLFTWGGSPTLQSSPTSTNSFFDSSKFGIPSYIDTYSNKYNTMRLTGPLLSELPISSISEVPYSNTDMWTSYKNETPEKLNEISKQIITNIPDIQIKKLKSINDLLIYDKKNTASKGFIYELREKNKINNDLSDYINDLESLIDKDYIGFQKELDNEIMKNINKIHKNTNTNSDINYNNALRFMEPLGSSISLGDTVFSKYTPTTIQAQNAPSTSYTPMGGYMSAIPFDRDYYSNQLTAQLAGMRRALMNGSSPSKYANMLIADYNAGLQYGDLARKGAEFNSDQRLKYGQYNRDIDKANLSAQLESNKINADIFAQNLARQLDAARYNSQMDFEHRKLKDSAIGTNLGNIFTSMGNIGRENLDRTHALELAKLTKGADKFVKGANGGKINRKQKKGLTF